MDIWFFPHPIIIKFSLKTFLVLKFSLVSTWLHWWASFHLCLVAVVTALLSLSEVLPELPWVSCCWRTWWQTGQSGIMGEAVFPTPNVFWLFYLVCDTTPVAFSKCLQACLSLLSWSELEVSGKNYLDFFFIFSILCFSAGLLCWNKRSFSFVLLNCTTMVQVFSPCLCHLCLFPNFSGVLKKCS